MQDVKTTHEENHDFNKKSHIRILSINGGGVKGMIPAKILEHIEKEAGVRIQDLFDYFAGTSVGGIMALALTAPNEKTGDYLFKAEQLPKICSDAVGKVFPPNYLGQAAEYLSTTNNFKWLSDSVWSLSDAWTNTKRVYDAPFSREGIDSFLESKFGETRFNSTLKPVSVFSYNENVRGPKIWSSFDKDSNYRLMDAAGATSAAPTYLPPKKTIDTSCFEACQKEQPAYSFFGKSCSDKCATLDTDGGILVNNPSGLGYEIVAAKYTHLNRTTVTIVSLGTGKVKFDPFNPKPLTGTGTAMFGDGNILSKALEGFQDTADFTSKVKFHDNYLVFNPFIKQENNDLDDSSTDNMRELERVAEEYLSKPQIKLALSKLINCLKAIPLGNDLTICKEVARVLDGATDINYSFSHSLMEKMFASEKNEISAVPTGQNTDSTNSEL